MRVTLGQSMCTGGLNQSLKSLGAVVLLLSVFAGHTPARATLIDLATGGVGKATANLVIDGINLGLNGLNAGTGVVLNRPWVFMFADGTPAPQVFRSAVALPGGIATNTATSSGFLGTATSSATANGATGVLTVATSTRGLASANALAGIGTTGISALPFRTALTMHLTTIAIDPLSAPDVPVSQEPPPDPDTFPIFDPDFVPASATVDAYLQNELGESVSLFHLELGLKYDSASGRFDDLNLVVSGLGSPTTPSAIEASDFSFFDGPDGFGYQLTNPAGIDVVIPYDLPTGWQNLRYSAVLETQGNVASTAAVPEPSAVLLVGFGLALMLIALRNQSIRKRPSS